VSFVISVDKIANGIRVGRLYIKGIDNIRHYQRGKNLVILKGELFPDMKDEELFDVAFVLSLTILGQTIRTTTTQPLATLSVVVLFILRIALVYTGLGKLNEIKQ